MRTTLLSLAISAASKSCRILTEELNLPEGDSSEGNAEKSE